MTERNDHTSHTQRPGTFQSEPVPGDGHQEGHSKHGWMMIACCIPMLIIAVALVATGIVSPGFLVFAIACTAMMAMMMRGMHGGGASHNQNR